MKENLNPFAIAQAQFDEAAEVLQLNHDMRAFLREPMREFHFTIPVRMDDGTTRTFQGSVCSTTTPVAQPKAAYAFTRMKRSTPCGRWQHG